MLEYEFRNFNSFQELKQFFRREVKKLHPDRGGDPEEFLRFIKWYESFSEAFRNSQQVEIVKNCPTTGNYFFKILELSVEEVALGGKKKVKVPGAEVVCPSCRGTGKKENGKTEKCGFCEGRGWIEVFDRRKRRNTYLSCPYCKGMGYLFMEKCEKCMGRGKIREEKEVLIDIPLGLREGDIIFLPKEKADSSYDLYFEINISPHPYFRLEGNNIVYSCKIPFWEIILKEEISIPTLEGEEKIPSRLFTKENPIVLKHRGPFLKDGKRGDFLIDYRIVIPEEIPFKARSLIEEAVKYINKNHEG